MAIIEKFVESDYPDIFEMTNEEYHSSIGISKSSLDKFAKSPAHYLYSKNNPTQPTPAMQMGTLIHTAILDPSELLNRYAVAVNCDRRTKEGKEIWASFLESSKGKQVITQDEYELVTNMRETLFANPKIKHLLDGAEVEQSYFWVDKKTGLLCKCRPDAVNMGYLIDIKSTTDASPEAFAVSAYNFRYHNQSAWYLDGYAEVTGEQPKGFIFIAVEKTAPFQSAIYIADDLFVEAGRQENNMLLSKFAECVQTDSWHGYGGKDDMPITLNLPYWAYKQYEL